MTEQQATGKADKIIEWTLTNQQEAISKATLAYEDNAVTAAKALALFRMTLINELMKQPM